MNGLSLRSSPCGVHCLQAAGPQTGYHMFLCCQALPAVVVWELAVFPWGDRAEGPPTGYRELLCGHAPPAVVVWELAASPRGAPLCCLLLYPRDAGPQEGPLVFSGVQASLVQVLGGGLSSPLCLW